MKKFRNIKTGNIVSPKNPEAEKLMENSDMYEIVKPASKKGSKAADNAADAPDDSAAE